LLGRDGVREILLGPEVAHFFTHGEGQVMQPYRYIVFDLGGVLVELDRSPIPEKFFPPNRIMTVAEWSALPVAHRFERGEVGATEFAETIIADFDLRISVPDFIRHFSKWPKRAYPGAGELLHALARKYDLAILSNCNEIHWPMMRRDFGIFKYFKEIFSSLLIGMTKPSEGVYRYVVDQLACEPGDILYFDDNEKNVEAATRLGIRSIQVLGLDAVKACLESLQMA
jgi:putative hydrolase of the HAD superfamily